MKIAIYSRKSRETDTGQSIDNQINMCKRYFEIYSDNPTFSIFKDEGYSGSTINRPDFTRMMLLANKGEFDAICVYKIDRIARNITDFFGIYKELEIHNVKLISITENFDASTPIGKMMMTLLAGFADMERENIRQRVKDNLYELAKLGRWSGGRPPYGYKSVTIIENGKKNVYLELEKNKINTIQEIYSLALTTLPFRIGKKFGMSSKQVLSILRNPTYMKSDEVGKNYFIQDGYKVFGTINNMGFIGYNKTGNSNAKLVAVGKHEGVVTSDVWISANTAMNTRITQIPPRISQYTFLAHLCYCNECNALLQVSRTRVLKNGTRTLFFRCSTHRADKNACGFISVDCIELEDAVINLLSQISTNVTSLKKFVNAKNTDKEIENLKLKINKLEIDINESEKQMENITSKLIYLNDSALELVSNQLNILAQETPIKKEKLLKLQEKLFTLESTKLDTRFLLPKIKNAVETLKSNISIELKQEIANNLLSKISIDKDKNVSLQLKLNYVI